MPKKVTIFTTNTCASCATVKRFLDSKGVIYNVINLDEQPERQAEVLAKSGALTVPVTLIEKEDSSEEIIVGLNLQRLVPAIAV